MKFNISNLKLNANIEGFRFEDFIDMARTSRLNVEYNPETSPFPSRCIIKIDNVMFMVFKSGKMQVSAKSERSYRRALDKIVPIIRECSNEH